MHLFGSDQIPDNLAVEQVKDFDAEHIEALCAGEALEVAADIRDLLNESSRVNARKAGAGALSCISSIPSVGFHGVEQKRRTHSKLARPHDVLIDPEWWE